MKVALIGTGSWGTALAQVLGSKGIDVFMLARHSDVAQSITEHHRNPRYLSEFDLATTISAYTTPDVVFDRADAIVLVTPSAYVRSTVGKYASYIDEDTPIAICSKGVEAKTGLLMTEVVSEEAGNADRCVVLSGPTHAEEVIIGQPSAVVVAGSNPEAALSIRDLFATDRFRTYISDDPVGVELCGAFKNVIAIAVGISYGMGYGDNTAAAVITRGLAEMSRMVVACNGEAITCMGLAGAGDMVVTCMSRHSRNRRFGQDYVAAGKTLSDFESDTHMVVEGAIACKTLDVLAKKHNVDLPLTTAVRDIVWGDSDIRELARSLFMRPLTNEFYGLE